jgi:hypothetical protein
MASVERVGYSNPVEYVSKNKAHRPFFGEP